MKTKFANHQRTLEIILVLTTTVLTCLLYKTAGYKMIVLNLFYLPVVIAGFFLGRYRAGVLALFSVVAASTVVAMGLGDFAALRSPIVIGLALTVWGAVLGLTALLVGTLSDERDLKIVELHEAYVGVVEVLSRYLQSANPRLENRSHRVAELSQKISERMNMAPGVIDDIRVAALLYDMENIEITARVIRKAVDDLDGEEKTAEQHTFHGTELVNSLGSVLTGAMPLVMGQSESDQSSPLLQGQSSAYEIPLGAQIIQVARSYDSIVHRDWGGCCDDPQAVIEELRSDPELEQYTNIFEILAQVVFKSTSREKTLQTEADRPKLQAADV